jgi:phosphate transport system permease protein
MALTPTTDPISPAMPSGQRGVRDRKTKRSVLIADKVADWTITVGGLMVIVAVFGIMVFLAEVVVPLFFGKSVDGHTNLTLQQSDHVVWTSVDEYDTVGTKITADGTVQAFHLRTGRPLAAQQLDFGGKRASSVAGTAKRDQLLVGFDDGTVRFATVEYDIDILTSSDMPSDLTVLDGGDRTDGSAIYTEIPGQQIRRIGIAQNVDQPQQVADQGAAIMALDYRVGGTVERPTRSFVSIDANNALRLSRAETRINLLTRRATTSLSTIDLPPLPGEAQIFSVLLTSQADQVYAADARGTLYRYDTRDFNDPQLAEAVRVVSDADGSDAVTLSSIGFLIGEQSIVAGASDGSVNVFFRLQEAGAGTKDGYRMVRAHVLEPHAERVVGFAPGQRSKSFVTADAQGNVWFRHATSGQVLLKMKRPPLDPDSAEIIFAPRENGIVAFDKNGQVDFWQVAVPHPETTVAAVFGKAWYEGYPEPSFTWQSSSGTDVFEPKLSLVPLIFGTLKATVYSLIFAIPIALLAAIYTSEFLHRRIRATIKPMMEMMESLPTVVLGFIAALILAPIVETWIGAVVLAFVVLPMALVLAAYLWQMLPHQAKLRLEGVPKFIAMCAVVLLASYSAYLAGPSFEGAFFYGDFKAWTNGSIGTGTPFMFLILLPVSIVAVVVAFGRTVGTNYRRFLRNQDRARAPVIEFARWILVIAAAAILSFGISAILTASGFDPRGGIVDTYVQRNALVVGFVMGFAVIPNIYTIAEDSLNSVPAFLRAGSLAAGATPWQTALWIVVPTAMSGIFAAVMIGMGRAVGETMIVVMAAGNTPILEWNVFNGLRTLSATIAVELPEAVKDGTLYRTLFLAALTLFILTFCINTLAEIVRQRFRKRAFEL